MSEFAYKEMFPLGEDKTPYRLLTKDHVSTVEVDGKTVLKVAPEAITLLTTQAFKDCSHLLRRGTWNS